MSVTKPTVEEITVEHLLMHRAVPVGAEKLLRRAIELAKYVDTLNAWAAADPGNRVWLMEQYTAGFVGCTLTDRLHNKASSWELAWSREFGDQNANDIPLAALLAKNEKSAVAAERQATVAYLEEHVWDRPYAAKHIAQGKHRQ